MQFIALFVALQLTAEASGAKGTYKAPSDGTAWCKHIKCGQDTLCNNFGTNKDTAGGSTKQHICVSKTSRLPPGETQSDNKVLCFATDGVEQCSAGNECNESLAKAAACVSTEGTYKAPSDGTAWCKHIKCGQDTLCNNFGTNQDTAGGSTKQHICVSKTSRLPPGETQSDNKVLCFATDGVEQCSAGNECNESLAKAAACVSTEATKQNVTTTTTKKTTNSSARLASATLPVVILLAMAIYHLM